MGTPATDENLEQLAMNVLCSMVEEFERTGEIANAVVYIVHGDEHVEVLVFGFPMPLFEQSWFKNPAMRRVEEVAREKHAHGVILASPAAWVQGELPAGDNIENIEAIVRDIHNIDDAVDAGLGVKCSALMACLQTPLRMITFIVAYEINDEKVEWGEVRRFDTVVDNMIFHGSLPNFYDEGHRD